jgi:hypothetical protein
MPENLKRRLDLRALGTWSKQVRVEVGDGFEEVLLCTLGDRSEVIERGQEAMQQKLLEYRDGSERREALRQALLLLPAPDVADMAAEGERAAILHRLERERPDPVLPRRDLAAGESQEAFARRLASHEDQCRALSAAREQLLQQTLDGRRAELAELPKAELAELALPRRIDLECWQAFCNASDDWTLLRAVRRPDDSARPYFDDIDEVRRLHPAVKEQLKRAYLELDAGAQTGPASPPEADLPNSSSSSPGSG